MQKKLTDPVLDRVLFIGPSIKSQGGIASMLGLYRDYFHPFHYIASNSAHGTLPGLLNAALLMMRLPLERLSGRRLLHIHYASGKSLKRKQLIAAWGRLLGFRTVMHCHCNIIRASELTGENRMARLLGKADYNIVLASKYLNYEREKLRLPETRTAVVNNIAIPAGEKRRQTDRSPVTFLFLGLIHRQKGIYDLLEAAAKVKASGRTLRIIVGGKGEEAKFSREVRRLDLEDVVEFRGWISGEAKEAAWNDADVFVLPSYTEAMPLSILEAMGRGIPSIGTPVGTVPELISDCISGSIVPAGDSGSLAKAMTAYIDRPANISEEGEAALKKLAEYSPKAVFSSLIPIYRTVLSR